MGKAENPKIYHITHIENLPKILADGFIWSDAECLAKGILKKNIGMSKIKERRLTKIGVPCCGHRKVGEFVPFNFCPRSVMLYILHKSNHADLSYCDGQRPLVHLQADFTESVEWARKNRVAWAFSDRNAGASLAKFYNDTEKMGEIRWDTVYSNDFADQLVKEHKQAEFLFYKAFPWQLVKMVGVLDVKMRSQVQDILKSVPEVSVKILADWYF